MIRIATAIAIAALVASCGTLPFGLSSHAPAAKSSVANPPHVTKTKVKTTTAKTEPVAKTKKAPAKKKTRDRWWQFWRSA